MKTFLIKLGLVVLLFYSLLFILQSIVDAGLRNSSDTIYADWSLLFKGAINAPMVFLGNSRTEAHFDTNLITNNTHIPSYNLGVAGASMTIELLRWKSYLAHNKPPKIVVQNVDLFALTSKPIPNKEQFLPYYNEPEIRQQLALLDKTVSLETWIPMSKYRGYEYEVLKGLGFTFKNKKRKIRGYNSHKESWNNDFENFKKALNGKKIKFPKREFEVEFAALQKIITDCHNNNAKLILVWAPQYDELSTIQEPTLTEIKNRIAQLAQQHKNIVFWDFSTQNLNQDKHYFYNSFHLNSQGAAVFCRQFSDSLNVYLKKTIP